MIRVCANCTFFASPVVEEQIGEHTRGECRVRAPNAREGWPDVDANRWCGEFAPHSGDNPRSQQVFGLRRKAEPPKVADTFDRSKPAYTYSLDGKRFDQGAYATELAAYEAWVLEQDPEPGDQVTIACVTLFHASDCFNADISAILQGGAEQLVDDHADHWPDVTPGQDKELELAILEVVDSWADKHGLHPSFYRVESTWTRTAPEEKGSL